MPEHVHVLEVWGELACFTRPELKVERFSYPVITPSAARGIFDAIYFKRTEFRWQIHRIEIINTPAYIALRRNEVKDKAQVPAILKWMAGKEEPQPNWADGTEDTSGTDQKGRTQRQTMALRNVHYRLHATIRPRKEYHAPLSGLDEQFRRRAARGQCFQQPYFGCREFPAYFRLVEEENSHQPPCKTFSRDLGLMLYDVFDLKKMGGSDDGPFISLFRATVHEGILKVPEYDSDAVLKPDGGQEHA